MGQDRPDVEVSRRAGAAATSEADNEVVVIGAGPAGLGAAIELRRRGIDVTVLERAGAVAESWRHRYEGLRLNSVRWLAGIRRAPIPRRAGRWVTADDYVSYLEATARRHALDVRCGVEVRRVERDGEGYALATSGGPLAARHVVIATGYDRVPRMPDWPGREGFAGELLHASRYRHPAPFAGRDVLVVGIGNSGTEIAMQLARTGARRVQVAVRTPPNVFPREFLGMPIGVFALLSRHQPARLADAGGHLLQRLAWGDLRRYGLGRAPYGVGTELRVKGLGPVVDGGFVAELKRGRVEIVPAVVGFAEREVELESGRRIQPDTVIAATGYAYGLEELVGHLGVLLPSGRPARVDGGADPAAPGLHFNGYHLPITGQLHAHRATSRRIGREIARRRRRQGRPARRRAARWAVVA
jgi:putative flavoprotein involved in K+ transport